MTSQRLAVAMVAVTLVLSIGWLTFLPAADEKNAAAAVKSQETAKPGAAAEVPAKAGSEGSEATSASDERRKELLAGKVVLAQAALAKRKIRVADEMKGQAVLETAGGELIPIAADWRGRAFFQDERLRDRPVELVGYRREGLPYLMVLTVYTFNEKNERQDTDYWCDVCSIPMYEIKECECCQGPIRLRFRPAPASVPSGK